MPLTDERKIEIEERAEKVLADNQFTNHYPIDIVALAWHENFAVQRLNLDSDTSGMLLSSRNQNIAGLDKNKLVVVKKGLSEEQSRLILAHEMGHYYLSEKDNFIAHRRRSNLNSDLNEQEADYFARALLMPAENVVSLIDEMKNNKCSVAEIIKKIAEEFKVTDAKASVRYYELEGRLTSER